MRSWEVRTRLLLQTASWMSPCLRLWNQMTARTLPASSSVSLSRYFISVLPCCPEEQSAHHLPRSFLLLFIQFSLSPKKRRLTSWRSRGTEADSSWLGRCPPNFSQQGTSSLSILTCQNAEVPKVEIIWKKKMVLIIRKSVPLWELVNLY